jgi:hypothetical protein
LIGRHRWGRNSSHAANNRKAVKVKEEKEKEKKKGEIKTNITPQPGI